MAGASPDKKTHEKVQCTRVLQMVALVAHGVGKARCLNPVQMNAVPEMRATLVLSALPSMTTFTWVLKSRRISDSALNNSVPSIPFTDQSN
jgi:hypothetical protein